MQLVRFPPVTSTQWKRRGGGRKEKLNTETAWFFTQFSRRSCLDYQELRMGKGVDVAGSKASGAKDKEGHPGEQSQEFSSM